MLLHSDTADAMTRAVHRIARSRIAAASRQQNPIWYTEDLVPVASAPRSSADAASSEDSCRLRITKGTYRHSKAKAGWNRTSLRLAKIPRIRIPRMT